MKRFLHVGEAIGLRLALHLSDGSAPVGRGIGPALEAADVLAVLRRAPGAPNDLRERALALAGQLLDLAPGGAPETGRARAEMLLDSGEAEAKFLAICAAQGGFTEPELAPHRIEIPALFDGVISAIDNRVIARIAKLAGAPRQKVAGVRGGAKLGERVSRGQPLYEIHAATPGEAEWARGYAERHPDVFAIAQEPQ